MFVQLAGYSLFRVRRLWSNKQCYRRTCLASVSLFRKISVQRGTWFQLATQNKIVMITNQYARGWELCGLFDEKIKMEKYNMSAKKKNFSSENKCFQCRMKRTTEPHSLTKYVSDSRFYSFLDRPSSPFSWPLTSPLPSATVSNRKAGHGTANHIVA